MVAIRYRQWRGDAATFLVKGCDATEWRGAEEQGSILNGAKGFLFRTYVETQMYSTQKICTTYEQEWVNSIEISDGAQAIRWQLGAAAVSEQAEVPVNWGKSTDHDHRDGAKI